MKLHITTTPGIYLVTALGAGFVEINRARHTHSIILAPDTVRPWTVTRLETLTPTDLAELVTERPELVLIGTGAQHRFPSPAVYQVLINAGIGVEIMHTDAACRSYNFLANEGRRVVAALIIEAVSPA